jgi:hypothetical protein
MFLFVSVHMTSHGGFWYARTGQPGLVMSGLPTQRD